MKRMVLHEDEDLRPSSNIHHRDKYAMEFSDEYVDHSKIQKVHSPGKVEDTNDKINNRKGGFCHSKKNIL